MKFIQKIFYIFISFYFIFILLGFIINKQLYYNEIIKTLVLWFQKVLPATCISFILATFLTNYPIISVILYPFLKNFFHFENQKSCSLFLIAIIVGNPTSSKLISSAVINKEISIYEGNRLLNYSSFISSIFLYSIFDFNTFILLFIIELITSLIIAQFKQHPSINLPQLAKSKPKLLDIYFNIINTLPTLLLSILVSMIICNLFSLFIPNIYLKSLFELTNGIEILINTRSNIFNFIFLILLITSHGVAIILQIYWIIKNSSLSFKNFIVHRIIAATISLISLIIIYLFVFFL